MKIAVSCLGLVLLCVAPSLSFAAPTFVDESMSISFEKYSIQHQGPQVIDLTVSLLFTPGLPETDYPEVTAFYRTVDKLMREYPNETDWWEIWNKRVTAALLEAYPMAARVELSVSLHPTHDIPYPNIYRCTAVR
jgi:hypothetical protein